MPSSTLSDHRAVRALGLMSDYCNLLIQSTVILLQKYCFGGNIMHPRCIRVDEGIDPYAKHIPIERKI